MNTRHALAGTLVVGLLLAATPARAAVAVTVVTDATWPWDEPQQTERFSRTVALGKAGSVVLNNIAGDVVVTGGSGDQVVIEAVKRGRTNDDLKAIEIEVLTADGRVEITTKYPHQTGGRGWRSNAAVNYTLTVPRRAMVRVKTVSGDVQVSTVDGELQADSVSGNVRVTDAAQLTGATTVSGDVHVTSASSTVAVTVGSVSGSLTILSVKAPSVTGSSVSGDVSLTDVACDRVAVKSVSGGITFGGPLAKGGRYAMKSHSGDVVVKVMNAIGFEVNASSFSGDIRSDVPLTMRFGGGEERRGHRQDVRGTYGDGSAMLELNSFSGNIRIVSGGAKTAAPVKK